MLINICVGKYGQKDFPEVAQVEVDSVPNFILDKKFIEIIEEYISDINKKEKRKAYSGYSVKRTIFVEKDKNLFVWID